MTDSKQPSLSKPISFDVIIAGGAMAGATLALALHQLSQGKLKVAVIEAFATDHSAHPGFDARSIALSYGTVQILQDLQLWSSLHPFATPIEHIHVSDQSHAGMTDIHRESLGVEALGYVVELADVGRVYASVWRSVLPSNNLCQAESSILAVNKSRSRYNSTVVMLYKVSCWWRLMVQCPPVAKR